MNNKQRRQKAATGFYSTKRLCQHLFRSNCFTVWPTPATRTWAAWPTVYRTSAMAAAALDRVDRKDKIFKQNRQYGLFCSIRAKAGGIIMEIRRDGSRLGGLGGSEASASLSGSGNG